MKFKFNWGWGIAIVYTLFAAATLSFVFFAMTEEVDLVRPDYYEYSLTHDQRAKAQANARKLGDEALIEYGSQTLHIHIPRNHCEGIEGEVVLYRASSMNIDQHVKLKVDDSGTMVMSTDELAAGPWKVTATWKSKSTIYEIEKTIEVE